MNTFHMDSWVAYVKDRMPGAQASLPTADGVCPKKA